MKKLTLLLVVAIVCATIACSKSNSNVPEGPRTNVPDEIEGTWMHGEFSMIDYWEQYPGHYIGPGLEMAFAFTFNADGTYTQYFPSGAVMNGVQTYQQSVTKGTLEVDPITKVIKTHASKVHYRRMEGRQVKED